MIMVRCSYKIQEIVPDEGKSASILSKMKQSSRAALQPVPYSENWTNVSEKNSINLLNKFVRFWHQHRWGVAALTNRLSGDSEQPLNRVITKVQYLPLQFLSLYPMALPSLNIPSTCFLSLRNWWNIVWQEHINKTQTLLLLKTYHGMCGITNEEDVVMVEARKYYCRTSWDWWLLHEIFCKIWVFL